MKLIQNDFFNPIFNPNGRVVITLDSNEKTAINNEFNFIVIAYDAEMDKTYFAFQKNNGRVESTDSVVYYNRVVSAFDKLHTEVKRLWNKTTAELFN